MRLYPSRLSILAVLLIVLTLSLSGGPDVARAGGTVTNCVWSGAGGLQEALAGGGTVTFACDGTIIVPEIVIAVNTSLDATGHDVTLSGNHANRVLYVNVGVSLSITGLTIADGSAPAGWGGGGIRNTGTLTITNSTISGNSAQGGGGIDNWGGGILTVTNSTFSGNSAITSGGGIFSTGALTVTNSTFSGNSAAHSGGGIYAQSTVTVINSTFSGNSGPNGGGAISNSGVATVAVTNSIFADSPSGGNCRGVITNGGYNLSDDASCGFGTGHDSVDPLLEPLTDNGGPTQTHALQANSPALSAGNPVVCAADPVNGLDQRGEPRPQPAGENCDSGAFESSLPKPPLVVTNTNDSGPGSLRQAILDANASPGTDMISFAPGVSGPILLESTLPALADDVDILGPGAAVVALDGQGSRQIMIINSGTTATIDGLTFQNGFTIPEGGGIYSSGTLTLTNCVVTHNQARLGGGIYNNAGTLTVDGCTVDHNQGNSGSGIFSDFGIATVRDSTISYNESSDGSGAGLTSYGGSMTVLDSVVSHNQTGSAGGGGIGNIGTLIVDNSTISDNHAGSFPDCMGGGILSLSGTVTIRNGTQIMGNTAGYDGGGVFIEEGTLTVSGSSITGNTASHQGGGIGTQGTADIHDSLISGNTAWMGGGIVNMGNLEVNGSIVSGNTADYGGGIADYGGVGTATITESTIEANIAHVDGGGIGGGGTFYIIRSTISGNQAAANGGGILNVATTTIVNSTFSGNSAAGQGGGIYNDKAESFISGGVVTVINSTLAENSAGAALNPGGAIYNQADAAATITNSLLVTGATGANCYNDGGTFTDGGFNLSNDASCGFGTGHDTVDPLLEPLADNGGPTLTHALQPNSPALGAGNPAVCAADPVNNQDQRGEPRPQPAGENCDSGAFESALPEGSLSAPPLLAPRHKNRLATTTPTLTWEAISLAASYEVRIATDADLVGLVQQASVTETSYTADPLRDGRTYYWAVRGLNAGGEPGPWSVVWSFKIDTSAPPRPPRLSPSPGATLSDPTPTFRWGRDSESAAYVFQLAADEAFEIVLLEESLDRPRYDMITPLLPGVYWWRVAALDEAGNVSEWSAAYFTLVLEDPVTPPTDVPPTDAPPTDIPPTDAPPVLITPVPTQPPPPNKPDDPGPTPGAPPPPRG